MNPWRSLPLVLVLACGPAATDDTDDTDVADTDTDGGDTDTDVADTDDTDDTDVADTDVADTDDSDDTDDTDDTDTTPAWAAGAAWWNDFEDPVQTAGGGFQGGDPRGELSASGLGAGFGYFRPGSSAVPQVEPLAEPAGGNQCLYAQTNDFLLLVGEVVPGVAKGTTWRLEGAFAQNLTVPLLDAKVQLWTPDQGSEPPYEAFQDLDDLVVADPGDTGFVAVGEWQAFSLEFTIPAGSGTTDLQLAFIGEPSDATNRQILLDRLKVTQVVP